MQALQAWTESMPKGEATRSEVQLSGSAKWPNSRHGLPARAFRYHGLEARVTFGGDGKHLFATGTNNAASRSSRTDRRTPQHNQEHVRGLEPVRNGLGPKHFNTWITLQNRFAQHRRPMKVPTAWAATQPRKTAHPNPPMIQSSNTPWAKTEKERKRGQL